MAGRSQANVGCSLPLLWIPLHFHPALHTYLNPLNVVMSMNRKMVQLNEDVYYALYELKYDYRERSLSDTIAHMMHELGIEPYDEVYEDEDEDEG